MICDNSCLADIVYVVILLEGFGIACANLSCPSKRPRDIFSLKQQVGNEIYIVALNLIATVQSTDIEPKIYRPRFKATH